MCNATEVICCFPFRSTRDTISKLTSKMLRQTVFISKFYPLLQFGGVQAVNLVASTRTNWKLRGASVIQEK